MSDSDRRFQRKLAAFLQNPIDKPLLPVQTEERHEDRAERLREQLDLHELEARRPASDHFASAMERAFVPGEAAISFLEEPEVRHPFSGAPYSDIDALAELDPGEATEEVETALERLGPLEADENPQRSFFALWRTLIPVLRAHGPAALSKYWSVLPADTHIPDHSLFQHLTVASAFSGLSYEDSGLSTDATFLLVTIGPAQGFIQQSRKTQDL